QNLDEFNALLELEPFLNTPVRSLSLGQRMRADICAALLHNPDLLFLDEPTIGLDVVAKERIRRFIKHMNQERGTTILLTTHDMADVQKLCRRVMIIDQGKLLYDGNLDTLQTQFGGKRELVVDMAEPYETVEIAGAEVVGRENGRVTYQFARSAISASELIGRLSAAYRIQDLVVREPDIETTIRRIYEERLLAVE
ncbi:MAG: AAA family ATPase, partial [Anaerolineales bacterium]|nr:AAA family ATPase [Anaerolineales bacterium]